MRLRVASLALVLVALACRARGERGCPQCPDPAAVATTIAGRVDESTASLPDGDVVGDAMASAAARVRRCGPFANVRRAVVSVAFAATGAAIEARAFPPLAGTAQGACVQDAVRGVNLPATGGRALSLTWAYDLVAPAECAPAPTAAPHAAGSAAPVRCGHLDPETGLLRVCFDRDARR